MTRAIIAEFVVLIGILLPFLLTVSQESYQGVLLKSAPSELCLAVNTQNFAILQLQNCTQPVSPSELWQFNFTGIYAQSTYPTYQIISSGTGECISTLFDLNIGNDNFTLIQRTCDFSDTNQYWYSNHTASCNQFQIFQLNLGEASLDDFVNGVVPNTQLCVDLFVSDGSGTDATENSCTNAGTQLWTISPF